MARATSSASLLFYGLCRQCLQPTKTQRPQSRQILRSFSATVSQYKNIPAFTQTSNEPLNEILAEIRSKIFIPEIVPAAQQKLIFKESRQHILLNDPGVFYTTTDGEEIRLHPLSVKDRPKKSQTLHRVLDLMKSSGEWENLPSLLEGLHLSRQHAESTTWWPKMARVAIQSGRIDLILRCAARAEETGLVLGSQPEVVRHIIIGLHEQALESGFQGEKFDEVIYSNMRRFTTILEGKTKDLAAKDPNQVDFRQAPEVVGFMLEMDAGTALNSTGEVQTMAARRAVNLAKKLDSVWDNKIVDYSVKDQDDPKHVANNNVKWLLPMWNGVKLALKVDAVSKDPIGKKIQQRLPELEGKIKEQISLLEGLEKPLSGLNKYYAVLESHN